MSSLFSTSSGTPGLEGGLAGLEEGAEAVVEPGLPEEPADIARERPAADRVELSTAAYLSQHVHDRVEQLREHLRDRVVGSVPELLREQLEPPEQPEQVNARERGGLVGSWLDEGEEADRPVALLSELEGFAQGPSADVADERR